MPVLRRPVSRLGALHQARVQDAELGRLTVRRSGRNRKPNIVEIELEGFPEVKLGRVAQSRDGERSTVVRCDGEFPREERIHLLTRAVRHFGDRVTLAFADPHHQCGTRLRTGTGQSAPRKSAL